MLSTFIVNLERTPERKVYMEQLLSQYDFLDISFIKAVDGKDLSEQEIATRFDKRLAYKRYGRELNAGEMGCTLSHYKCYKKIVEKQEKYVFILEDDVTLMHDLSAIKDLLPYIDTNIPTILFLSADYWYYKTKKINETSFLMSVFDAVGSYAYLINYSAAKLILKKNTLAANVADSWALYKRQGVRLKAIYPYLIDANIESFDSTINQTYFGGKKRNMSWKMRMDAYLLAIGKKLLRKNFVSKVRI